LFLLFPNSPHLIKSSFPVHFSRDFPDRYLKVQYFKTVSD
jgi:hypothetical protein